MPPTLSSAESWGLCNPHELFLERGDRGALAGFVTERASAYRAYAQALESALELLASPGERQTSSSPGHKGAWGGRNG